MAAIEADYLVVGSGAVGMAFADVLLHETDHTMVVVDRHHAPGGHWNDAYPFVRLHQPSATYGVNSRDLGSGARDRTALNLGLCERASSASILYYYEELMRDFVDSGRLRYFPMCEYEGDYVERHRFTSLTGGEIHEAHVRDKVVDTSYLNTAVPSTHPPKYGVAAGVECVPPNDLPHVKRPPAGYVVIGAGKTGIDACLWLLQNQVSPDDICWIVPRDPWLQNRANVQPAEEFFERSFGAFAIQAEIAAAAETIDALFAQLEATGQLLRLDTGVTPTMYHGAIVSLAELHALRQIKNVVRMGRIQRIERDRILLERGTAESSSECLYVDCSASAVERRPATPIFTGRKITPQMVRALQPTFSSAFIAHIEASIVGETEKNELCTPIPMSDAPQDWLNMMLMNLTNQDRWRRDPQLRDWITRSRLDRFSDLARKATPADAHKVALLQRYGHAASAAVPNLQRLIANATAPGS
ncbi:FAD/NAD(P)-binding protein [Arthrobacter sp. SRS-W-1-2016]|uniref:NAD(P)-binding protein n=1 Tax=Arthrobacter sp. SRS-W-1-2016 TaxID=1930254 RepID=UPI001C0C5A39|nr:FAD/NAD(P)-binding protein [Arthrobacter sp. SRS-W-1-2016]